MKRAPRNAVLLLIGITMTAMLAPLTSAGAAQSFRHAAVRSTAHSADLVVSRVSLTLTSSVVTPGEVTTIVAQVRPRAAGRVVLLRGKRHGRFVNLKISKTNAKGIAQFKYAFGSLGTVILRVSAVATATALQATSTSAVESVDTQLPFMLTSNTELAEGASGAEVFSLQQHLNTLGYWVGPPDAHFGDATQQAVYALEKAAGIGRTGVVNQAFVTALNAGVLPHPRTTSGDAIEVDLSTDLLMVIKSGMLEYVLNTSTGGGYTYTQDGATYVAITPSGVYSIARVVDGTVTDSLGTLWRPRFFYEGFAIHGDSYVPPVPVSHGCVRISNEAIDWVWAQNIAPIGEKVWVY